MNLEYYGILVYPFKLESRPATVNVPVASSGSGGDNLTPYRESCFQARPMVVPESSRLF